MCLLFFAIAALAAFAVWWKFSPQASASMHSQGSKYHLISSDLKIYLDKYGKFASLPSPNKAGQLVVPLDAAIVAICDKVICDARTKKLLACFSPGWTSAGPPGWAPVVAGFLPPDTNGYIKIPTGVYGMCKGGYYLTAKSAASWVSPYVSDAKKFELIKLS